MQHFPNHFDFSFENYMVNRQPAWEAAFDVFEKDETMTTIYSTMHTIPAIDKNNRHHHHPRILNYVARHCHLLPPFAEVYV